MDLHEEIIERLLICLDRIASTLEQISADLNKISTDCLVISGNVDVSGEIDVNTDKVY